METMLKDLQNKISIFLNRSIIIMPLIENKNDLSVNESFSAISLENKINKIWEGISFTEIRKLLATKVNDLVIICDADSKDYIGTGYMFHNPHLNGAFSIWLAYPPLAIDEQITFSKRFPHLKPYIEFLSIHNGFVLNGNGAIGLRSVKELVNLNDSDGEAYFGFCGDGLGNFQCFPITPKNKQENLITFDWDHESQEISHPVSFQLFVQQYLNKEMSG